MEQNFAKRVICADEDLLIRKIDALQKENEILVRALLNQYKENKELENYNKLLLEKEQKLHRRAQAAESELIKYKELE
jgi:hypothetical protein